MTDLESRVIAEAIDYVISIRFTGGHGEPSTPQPVKLERAVKALLEADGINLEALKVMNDD